MSAATNARIDTNEAVPAALQSPLFRHLQQTRLPRQRLHSKSLNVWKRIHPLATIASLVALAWLGGVLPPAAVAFGGKAVRSRSRVVPVIVAAAVATGAGLVVGKNLDSSRADEEESEEESEEEKEDSLETKAVKKVPPPETKTAEEPTVVKKAKEAERLKAQQLVEKTLKKVKDAERRRAALNPTPPKDAAKPASTNEVVESKSTAPPHKPVDKSKGGKTSGVKSTAPPSKQVDKPKEDKTSEVVESNLAAPPSKQVDKMSEGIESKVEDPPIKVDKPREEKPSRPKLEATPGKTEFC